MDMEQTYVRNSLKPYKRPGTESIMLIISNHDNDDIVLQTESVG
jgi:hypothetical protein